MTMINGPIMTEIWGTLLTLGLQFPTVEGSVLEMILKAQVKPREF